MTELTCYAAMFKRTILKDVKLSDGTDLLAGTLIDVPAGAMTRDKAIVPGGNPNEFDGFRYYRLRQEASREDAAKHLFATVSIDGGMHFGYGRRACPGRFFTTNLIKLVLAHLLLEYDFKMPEEGLRRYENLRSEATNFVDPSKNLLFRKIALE
jgi:ent-kaurene oxidase